MWQEVLMGSERSILAGGKVQILFHEFQLAILYLAGREIPSSRIASFVDQMRFLVHLCAINTRPPCEVLLSMRSCECSDPRDRIYVAQNLATPKIARIEPDYTMDWQICYIEWARQYLREFRALNF